MKTQPSSIYFHYQQGQLFAENVPIQQLAAQYGTPLYIYSKAALLNAVAAYQQALAGHPHLICYSVKANSNLAVLQLFAQTGCGFDIVSGGELQRVLAAGAPAHRVVFSGVGKTRAEIRHALQAGIKCFNVESLEELDLLSHIAQEMGVRAPVSLRINPDVDAKTHPYISTGLKNNKFGIAYEQALPAYMYAAALPGLRITGIDCHIGSQITETAPYLDALTRLLDLVAQLRARHVTLEHIDLGGGLGISYDRETPPTPQTLYGAILDKLSAQGFSDCELLVEPGRSLVGNAGALITEVLYLKKGETKNFCIVDAAMNDLVRPAMYEAYHAIVPVRPIETSTATTVWDVVGPICESSDWLGHDRPLNVCSGDLLALLCAGAYGMTMASNYNTRPRAAEVLVDRAAAYLIREREKVIDLFAGEHLLPQTV